MTTRLEKNLEERIKEIKVQIDQSGTSDELEDQLDEIEEEIGKLEKGKTSLIDIRRLNDLLDQIK